RNGIMAAFAMARVLDPFGIIQQFNVAQVKRRAKRVGVGGLPPLAVDIGVALGAETGGGERRGRDKGPRCRFCLARRQRSCGPKVWWYVFSARSIAVSEDALFCARTSAIQDANKVTANATRRIGRFNRVSSNLNIVFNPADLLGTQRVRKQPRCGCTGAAFDR